MVPFSPAGGPDSYGPDCSRRGNGGAWEAASPPAGGSQPALEVLAGSMIVLCTDKTGTITEGDLSLTMALDASGQTSEETARLAWLNARLQTGYTNPLDAVISTLLTYLTRYVGDVHFLARVDGRSLNIPARSGQEQQSVDAQLQPTRSGDIDHCEMKADHARGDVHPTS